MSGQQLCIVRIFGSQHFQAFQEIVSDTRFLQRNRVSDLHPATNLLQMLGNLTALVEYQTLFFL